MKKLNRNDKQSKQISMQLIWPTAQENREYLALTHVRDEAKETSLVACIQLCIQDVVEAGLVQTTRAINITQWQKICYTNIPQQEDGYVFAFKIIPYLQIGVERYLHLQPFLRGIHNEVYVVMER